MSFRVPDENRRNKYMDEIEILKELVKINTVADKENAQFLNCIQKYLEELGFVVENKDKYLVMSIRRKS